MPYTLFRRQPVPGPYAQALQTVTLPAPTRGIIQSENEAYMLPGGAIVQDNWAPTMRGCKLRGGCIRWCDLNSVGVALWANATFYATDAVVYDAVTISTWRATDPHTSAATGTFEAARAAAPNLWKPITGDPIISAFEYVSGANQRMYAGQQTNLYDVTASAPLLVKSGQTSGNYCAAHLEDASGVDWMIVVNESGDNPLRTKDGITWTVLDGVTVPSDGASTITGPSGALPPKLGYVWSYRNRLYFIEVGSMTAWYLDINAVGGALSKIPLGGAATKGGELLFGAVWSLDAGDGVDDKCVFVTTLGEILVFTGSNPSDSANWRQEGRYAISPPMGMNAHITVGGDLLIMTVDGIVPISQAITKEAGQLELALLTRSIKPLWRDNVAARRASPWTIRKWDEYGAMFVAVPGGDPGNRYCLVTNNVTGAWCRFLGYDATCFIRLRADMFFGTQDGIVMQADRSGADDGVPYVAVLVGGWEMFGAPSNEVVWHQARATFHSAAREPFQPQLAATTDFIVTLPPPPPPGPDPGVLEVWDEGLWDEARWDQPGPAQIAPVRNTMWVSVGQTGFAHAPIVQVTVAQTVKPNVELLALSATFERAGVNV